MTPPPRDSKRPNPILAFSSFLKSYVSNDSGADSEKPTATSSSNSSTTAGNTELNRKLLSACNDPDTSIQDVKQLLKQGASANAMLDGLSPFLACCRTSLANIRNGAFYSSLEIARTLVKSGADVNCANYNGVNAFGLMLNYNIVYGDEEDDQTLLIFMNKPTKRPPEWVFDKLAYYTNFLAEVGFDFDKTCEKNCGITPLEAATQISPKITESILDIGADPNCAGIGGAHSPHRLRKRHLPRNSTYRSPNSPIKTSSALRSKTAHRPWCRCQFAFRHSLDSPSNRMHRWVFRDGQAPCRKWCRY